MKAKWHPIPDAQVAAFLKHYKWLLAGKPRDKLAYRIIERQREEIALLRTQVDTLKGTAERRWTERVTATRGATGQSHESLQFQHSTTNARHCKAAQPMREYKGICGTAVRSAVELR